MTLAAEMQPEPRRIFSGCFQPLGRCFSPKRYQQYLTLGHAKSAPGGDRFTTLDTAFETVGLSGGGRLHDLFVTMGGHEPRVSLRARAARG